MTRKKLKREKRSRFFGCGLSGSGLGKASKTVANIGKQTEKRQSTSNFDKWAYLKKKLIPPPGPGYRGGAGCVPSAPID
jgi:hypothetical protein